MVDIWNNKTYIAGNLSCIYTYFIIIVFQLNSIRQSETSNYSARFTYVQEPGSRSQLQSILPKDTRTVLLQLYSDVCVLKKNIVTFLHYLHDDDSPMDSLGSPNIFKM